MSRPLRHAFSAIVTTQVLGLGFCVASSGCGGAEERPRHAGRTVARADATVDSAWSQAAEDWDNLCVQMGTLAAERISACTSGHPTGSAERHSICDAISASILAGRISFVATEAQACIERIRTVACQELLGTMADSDALPDLCPELLQGQSGVDGFCTHSHDCIDPRGLACFLTSSCNGVCRPRTQLGQACSSWQCERGSTCSSGGCIRSAGEGQPCGRDVAQCQPLLLCDASGICVRPTLGRPCVVGDWGSASCGLYLTCRTDAPASDGGAAGTCAAFARLGESCALGSFDCGWGSYCMPADGGGVCAADGRVGDSCGPLLDGAVVLATRDCLDGYCDRRLGELGGHCQPFRQPGEPCARDVECDLGAQRRCVAGACRRDACP